MGVKPIRPDEVASEKEKLIPDTVIETFNRLIAERGGGGSVTIRQDEVVKILVDAGLERREIFERHWLDVEGIYRQAGWDVEYDKPGFNETYDPKYTFRKKSG